MALIKQNGAVALQQATAVATAPWVKCYGPSQSFQSVLTGTTGAITATVLIEASMDGVNAIATPLATITLTGTAPTPVSDGFSTGLSAWAWIRSRVTVITAGATVTTWMGG
jgi:hypothetical protein